MVAVRVNPFRPSRPPFSRTSLAARTLTSLKLRRRGAATIFAHPRRLAVIFISTGPVKLRRSPRNFIPRGPGLNATSTTFCPSNTRFFRNSPAGGCCLRIARLISLPFFFRFIESAKRHHRGYGRLRWWLFFIEYFVQRSYQKIKEWWTIVEDSGREI